MILRGIAHINKHMQLKRGDRFLVNVQFPLTVHDDAAQLNGYWLTVESTNEEPVLMRPMGVDGDMEGFIHNAYRDEAIEAACGEDTSSDMYWWDMEAIDVYTEPQRPLAGELPNI